MKLNFKPETVYMEGDWKVLAEICLESSGITDRDFKWGENHSVLFHFLNWYEMFRSFRPKRNEFIKNSFRTTRSHKYPNPNPPRFIKYPNP